MPPSVSLPQTIFVLAVSSRSSSTPSVNLFYTNDLQSLCLPSICFLFFTLSDHCLLMNACSFCGGNCAFHTLVFKRGAYLTSCAECCCHSAPPASCKVSLYRGVANRVQDDMWTSSTEPTGTYCARKDHAWAETIHTQMLIHRMGRDLLPWWMHGCMNHCLTVASSCHWFTCTGNKLLAMKAFNEHLISSTVRFCWHRWSIFLKNVVPMVRMISISKHL